MKHVWELGSEKESYRNHIFPTEQSIHLFSAFLPVGNICRIHQDEAGSTIEWTPGTLYVLNKYAVTLTVKPPDGATVGNSLLFHSNSKEFFLSKYYLEKSLGTTVTAHTSNYLLLHPTPDIAGPQSHQIFKSVWAQSYREKSTRVELGDSEGVLSTFSL